MLLAAVLPMRAEEERPAESGVVEQVEVQLVLLDVLVLDRRERTIGSLGRGDFDLLVDGRPVEIATLDVDCPAGTTRDARAGKHAVAERPGEVRSRRIVHAFDYYHMDLAARTLEQARAAIRRRSADADRQMLVSIGPGLRIEQHFTSDVQELDRSLERMRDDPDLYAGHFGRLTDRRFYHRLEALMDFLERIEGPKVVVLYSGPFLPDGFDHDPEFRRIAALAARARVALYPVDSGGLRTPNGFSYGDLGGPKELARLAVETGGRVTYHTNDLGLALGRAQRDLGCRYTLGFHDPSPRPDRARAVRVWMRRAGLRVVHPAFYIVRSDERLLADRVRSAGMVPEMFDSGGMRVAARAWRPQGPGRWDVLVSVELPEAAPAVGQADPWRLEGTLHSPSGATLARFARDVAPPPAPPDASARRALIEHVQVEPGRHDLGVVAHRRGDDEPLAARIRIDLPPVPQDEVFLVGPHVGRFTAGPVPRDLAPGAAEEGRFEPLDPQRVRQGTTIDALTWVCRAGRPRGGGQARVQRSLTADSGEAIGKLETAMVELDRLGALDCRALVDTIPTATLRPGRYAVRAHCEPTGVAAAATFAVVP